MTEKSKIVLTFSFGLPVEGMTDKEVEKMVKKLVSNGSIGLNLPKGCTNLNLESLKVDTEFKIDIFEKFSLDTDTVQLEVAQDLRMIRMCEKHKR